jgi:hypothetical protein
MSSNSQANAYELQKNARFAVNLSKVRPDMKNKYPQYLQPSLYLFKNPIFEEFFTKYMDETQHLISEAIGADQFQTINWRNGVPNLMIELLSEMTGAPEIIEDYF